MVLDWATFFAALAVAWVYWKELCAMQDMNRITKEGMHYAQRAWVGVDAAQPINFEARPQGPNAGVSLTVAFTLKNYGLSAADKVRFDARLVSDPLGPDHLPCEEVEKITAKWLLMPTQHATENYVMNLTESQIRDGFTHQNPQLGRSLVLRVEGCILYSDKLNEPPHRTPFNYLVLPITPDKSIEGKDLQISAYFVNSGEAR